MSIKNIFLVFILVLTSFNIIAKNGATWDKKSYLPFEVISSIADNRLEEWLNRPSDVKSFSLKKPVLPTIPKAPTLIKDEFETTQQFENRVVVNQKQYDKKIIKIQQEYQKQKENYNQAVKEYNLSLEIENKRRVSSARDIYWQFVFEAFSKELGEPTLKLVEYNADLNIFYGILTSSRSIFSQWIAINVPLSNARNIKNNQEQVLPVIKFDKDINNDLIISGIYVTFGKHKYNAKLVDKPIDLSKTIKETIKSKKIQSLGEFIKITK